MKCMLAAVLGRIARGPCCVSTMDALMARRRPMALRVAAMCMGFSRKPRNEGPFSPASAAKGPAFPITKALMKRSMPSPPISKRTSTSTGFLGLRDDERRQHQSQPMDAAGKSIKRERAHYVFGGSLVSRADPHVVDLDFAIRARAAEPQFERARECRLGPAGIGGRVSAPVAPHRAPR